MATSLETIVSWAKRKGFMDTAIIAHPTTWKASGHLDSFSDALIDDKKTGQRFRADKIIENYFEEVRNGLSDEELTVKL